MDNLTTQLSEIEKTEFEILEATIKRSMGSFIAVGKALFTIRDSRLYRGKYKTFEDYCKQKWGVGRSYARYLIDGSLVATNLLTHDVHPGAQLYTPCEIQPIHEKQVRPLVVLEPAQQCEVWEKAVRSADGKIVTYKQVLTLVKEVVAPVAPKPKEPEEYSDAVGFALVALSQLSRIRDKDPRRDEAINMVSDWVEKEKNKKIGRNK